MTEDDASAAMTGIGVTATETARVNVAQTTMITEREADIMTEKGGIETGVDHT